MEELKKEAKRIKWDSIIIAVLTIIVGVVCVALPESSGDVLTTIFGIALIAIGVTEFARFFAFGGLIFGGYFFMAALTATVSGIFCLACPGIVQGIITVLFGVYIVVDSASALSESLECARVHQKGWVCMFILSLITAIMGVFVMFFSTFDFVMVFAGVSLIVEGVRRLVITLTFSSRIREAKRQVRKLAEDEYEVK